MSSILTNNAAMTALQTLKGINSSLETTQSQIATGKKIASAKDNSAIWAVSKTMEADVEGFKSISDTLGLADSTTAVAKNAAESTTDLLKEIKGKIVDAQEDSTDARKIQTDIESLRDQINSVVSSAQFNGVNLVNGSTEKLNTDGRLGVDFLASLDRDSSGTVTPNNVGIDAQNLSDAEGTLVTGGSSTGAVGGSSTATITFGTSGLGFTGGSTDAESLAVATDVASALTDTSAAYAGDVVTLSLDGQDFSYTVQAGDDASDIGTALQTAAQNGGFSAVTVSGTAGSGLTVGNGTATEVDAAVEMTRNRGAMYDLKNVDVTTEEGASDALKTVESLIQSSIDAASEFGSSQNRIEIQSNFVGNLMDSLESGIGSLVDANMEEASARLQALQVQQQLGTRSLAIANQAPQSILSLFGG